MRHLLPLVVLTATFLPSAAMACGMYIPPEREERVVLADLFDEIDAVKPEAVTVEPTVQEKAEQAAAETIRQAVEVLAGDATKAPAEVEIVSVEPKPQS